MAWKYQKTLGSPNPPLSDPDSSCIEPLCNTTLKVVGENPETVLAEFNQKEAVESVLVNSPRPGS